MEGGAGDERADDDLAPFRAPLPPDDRLWRHPSEIAWKADAAGEGHRRTWVVAALSGLCGSVLTVGLLAASGVLSSEPRVREVVVREAIAPASLGSRGLADVARTAAQAVVRIEVSGDGGGIGSGVVISDDGNILTNAHVVDGTGSITVVLRDGRSLPARRVGSDAETDLAVVRVDAGEPIAVAVLGSVDDVSVGDVALAIGSPLGLRGAPSVTSGIVSGLGRAVESHEGGALLDMIQTDATIAPGSSGGALVDARGVLVGITTAFAVTDTGAEGMGFATPVDVARAVAADLVEHGRARPAWLGVKGDDRRGSTGALVEEVMGGSPAAEAGIEPGDVVVSVGRRHVDGMSALRVALRGHRPGEEVAVALLRDGERRTVRVSLVERPR